MSPILDLVLVAALFDPIPDLAPLAWHPLAAAPNPRFAFSAVHVPARGSVLVFAGERRKAGEKNAAKERRPAPELLRDLWEYELANDRWHAVETRGPAPGGVAFHAATFDAKRNAMWVFGGRDQRSTAKDELWRFDVASSAWTKLAPSGETPPARFGATLHFDARRDRLVLHGGCKASLQGDNAFPEVWTYDLTKNAWTRRALGPARWQAAAALCPELDVLVVHGGYDSSFRQKSDTWIYHLGRDVWADAGNGFGAADAHAAVWDPARKLVLFDGGSTASERALESVWSFDPIKKIWKELAVEGAGPGPRAYHAAVLVPEESLWVFGGTQNRIQDPVRGAEAWIAKLSK